MPKRLVESLPIVVEIEPTETCNLRCLMCHVSYMQPAKRPLFDASLLPRFDCLRDCYVILGSSFEPTIHPRVIDILDYFTNRGHRLEMITNATLLDAQFRNRLKDVAFEILNFSFDGIHKSTFERIRRGASFEKTVENISEMVAQLDGCHTFTAVNFTVMRSNMDEIMDAVAVWDKVGIDQLRFISMVARSRDDRVLKDSLFPVRDIYQAQLDKVAEDKVILGHSRITVRSPHWRNSPVRVRYPSNFMGDCVHSDHPKARVIPMWRQYYQLGASNAAMRDCRSPYTFARILANGDVALCNNVPVGNLHNSSLEDIWFGASAEALRLAVQDTAGPCRKCDYYRYCLKSDTVPTDDKNFYFSMDVIEALEDFHSSGGESAKT